MILVIGYGNPTRCDDGVGPYVAGLLAGLNIPHVRVLIVQQLQPELVEEAIHCRKIFLIDAAQEGIEVSVKKVSSLARSVSASSHYLSPETFAGLARTLYHKDLELYVCSILGENFDIGDTMSPIAYERAEEAFLLVKAMIEGEAGHA